MRRIIFGGVIFVLITVFLFIAEQSAYLGQNLDKTRTAPLASELRRTVTDSTDDAQQAVNDGDVFASAQYMELMLNWFQQRWGGVVRFPNITIPQVSAINSAYISVISYSTCWLGTYDSLACEDVDSAFSFSTASGSYDISNRWANRTGAFIIWNEDMRCASIYPDSTPNLKDLLQEVVNRPNWKSGNAVVFIFKNIKDSNDSAMFEFRTWEDHGYEESLFVNYTPPSVVLDGDSLLTRPTAFILAQNYPNPFNLKTNINYILSVASGTKLTIYDLLGKRVKTLVDEYQMPGYKSFDWDATDDKGNIVSSGIYFYQLQAEGSTQTKKMLLLK
jgi:hypothetical protein